MHIKTSFIQLIRYGIVGFIWNALGYLLYFVITAIGMEHKLAMTLLYLIVVTQTFIFNKQWSFRYVGSHTKSFYRYCIAYFAGYVINLASLFIFVDKLGYVHQIVQAIIILILAIMLFIIQKFWVFRSTAPNIDKASSDI
jgi:putative flippase GtrA